MAEWLFENGIGERRAALVDDGRLVFAEVERDGDGPTIDSVLSAQLIAHDRPRRRAHVRLDGGAEAWLQPAPSALTEGSTINIRVTRMALAEADREKRAQVAPEPDGELGPGPDLRARLHASGVPVREILPGDQPDLLERAGWGDVIEAARTGQFAFAGGALAIALTPAMVLIDVDGDLPPPALALAGAQAAADAIRLFGISGSIGIDFPTLSSRAERQAVDQLLGSALADWPHERTAMNGFGFVQLVARRMRPSLLERVQLDPVTSDALQLLRQAERAIGSGPIQLTVRPAVARLLADRHHWTDQLQRRLGRAVVIISNDQIGGAGHAQ